jgi:hypothetical protein
MLRPVRTTGELQHEEAAKIAVVNSAGMAIEVMLGRQKKRRI